MPCLCEWCSFWQAAWPWWKVAVTNLHLHYPFQFEQSKDCCMCWICFVFQGGWHAGHGTHASGEFPVGLPDHSHSRARGDWAHLTKSHQELLCGWTHPQTSLRRGEGKSTASWKRWHGVCCTAHWAEMDRRSQLFADWHLPLKDQTFRYLTICYTNGCGWFPRQNCFTGINAVLFLNMQHLPPFLVDFSKRRAHFDKLNIPCDSSYTHK